MRFLVTGAAGFIGFHLCRSLVLDGYPVVGVDNLDPYYSVQLKRDRLAILEPNALFDFTESSVADERALTSIFNRFAPTHVVHLAAQAGVRYSLANPKAYVDANLVGFANVLECCRQHHVRHLVFASSSSVYGLNTDMPFSVRQNVDHPISLYAATKKSNELMAHSYSYLYDMPCTGLRFFTVYGPWGRPDMALFRFTSAMLEGKPIDVYNQGHMKRDFTYIDDSVECVRRLVHLPPVSNPDWDGRRPNPATSPSPYRILNIGNGRTVGLMEFVSALEECLGAKANCNFLPMQPGDVAETHADSTELFDLIGFRPKTTVRDGIRSFVDWYKAYFS
ncbi:MAG: NAD-dependent epimerase [Deltaproteobacteria bacterium]|nr:NAD-dependent epimerase [Deltaproteobacteria bacterium]